ncbi:uncharacterized protein A4U43_C02F5220 [Asparagus officinalis]|uniref:TPX2 C-terminal domain-containing protein n=1 Tax=Asparagus officinalis TaxID=4686 RepID=A0A5P1FL44_ASPOF|nr:uncharacterized protein LOC109830180 isoform X2 [Asparagus officinalis]ONK77310.1 uncharacterized protein A4U43_C02F5220 [Asparagus officinalis]
MTAYVDQAYRGWSHEEIPRQDDSQEISTSQILDHDSISFGRFAYETSSWERRSIFTVNKCQEELEKFKNPGLVAKKKAYFEEHYKRIRAVKALQESQQMEMTLEYGGESSISSQAGEEEETGAQLENIGGAVADDVVLHPEEAPNEYHMKVVKDCSKSIEVQIAYSDTGLVVSDSGSCRNNFEECKEADNTICPPQVQHLDMDLTAHESSSVSIEEPEQQDLSDDDDRGVLRENTISAINIAPKIVSGEVISCLTNSKVGVVELKPSQRMVPKAIPSVRKYIDSVSVPKLKEPPVPARNGPKLESKTKPNIQKPSHGPKYPNIQKPSQGLKYPIQETTVKSGNGVSSIKATANKVSRNSKSTFVAYNGPLTEVRSNVTVPRPFSLATDKRATVPSGSREGKLKVISKSSNQKSSSAVKGKDVVNIQGISKGPAMTGSMKNGYSENKSHEEKKKSQILENQSTSLKMRGATVISSSMKNRRLEIKSGHEEKKKPVSWEQSTSLKGRGACVPGPVKARSLNLPPCGKFSSNSGADVRSNDSIKDNLRKEGRNQGRVTEVHKADTKIFTPPVAKLRTNTGTSNSAAAKVRTEMKKMASSWTNNSSCNMRKPRFGEQSLDGKKPRQEKPRWR